MSKSSGNAIDPLEIIDQYGAMLCALLWVAYSQGRDINLSRGEIEHHVISMNKFGMFLVLYLMK